MVLVGKSNLNSAIALGERKWRKSAIIELISLKCFTMVNYLDIYYASVFFNCCAVLRLLYPNISEQNEPTTHTGAPI